MATFHLLSSESALETFVADFAPRLSPGDVVVLRGEMGAGKTTFVRYLAKALGSSDHVSSPTFALVQHYEAALPITHADFYRLEGVATEALGLEDLVERASDGVLIIEWAEHFLSADVAVPNYDIELRYVPGQPTSRELILVSNKG